jgi:hypothetical protein
MMFYVHQARNFKPHIHSPATSSPGDGCYFKDPIEEVIDAHDGQVVRCRLRRKQKLVWSARRKQLAGMLGKVKQDFSNNVQR